jgi:hypothetical protein
LLAGALIRAITSVWFTSQIVATPANREIATPPLTERVLVIVVDGLRYDTALESDLMPKLQELARGGAAGVSLASRVTMTGLGVRTLGTGTSPGLADILLETKLPPFTYDNIFASLRQRGGHIAWLGNTAWKELFGDDIDVDLHIDRYLNVMAEADNVWGADVLIATRGRKLTARSDWQLCILHFGGLDNASHRFTPFGEEFRKKARSIDDDIAIIVAAAGPSTTTIITSDHGTSDAGHHGSGEDITRRTPLVITGAMAKTGVRLDAQQTDIVPTIAALLGLPIPAPNEGRVLVDALAIPAATSEALLAANAHQQQRYAQAVAARWGTTAPAIDETEPGLRRLGQWLADSSARSRWSPVLWAIALMLVALMMFATPPSVIASCAMAAIAAASLVQGGTYLPAAALAVLLAAGNWIAILRRHGVARSVRWRNVALVVLGVAAIEGVFALYKLEHRFIEMKMNDVYRATALSDATVQLIVTALATAAAAALAKHYWPRRRAAAIAALFVVSAFADTFAIPAAVVFGCGAILGVAQRREALAIAGAAALGVFAIWLPDAATSNNFVAALAVVALGGLGVWLGPKAAANRALLTVLALAAALVEIAGKPEWPYRATLLGIVLVGAVAAARRSQEPLIVAGWALAIVLALLSRSSQLLGLIAWTTFASLAGRCAAIRASDDRALVAACLAVVAFRFGCFAVFERVFEFSHLEVWVAYDGNPKAAVAFGAAVIALKFALPLIVGMALIAGHMTAAAQRRLVAFVAAFLCLRTAHIAIGMTVASNTFYSPYYDSGQLAFTALMLVSVLVPALACLWSIVGDRGSSAARSPAA